MRVRGRKEGKKKKGRKRKRKREMQLPRQTHTQREKRKKDPRNCAGDTGAASEMMADRARGGMGSLSGLDPSQLSN